MNTENNRHIDELIGNVLEDKIPADVDRRLRSQLDNFRSRLGEMKKPAERRSMALGRRVWFGVSAAAASIAVAALIWWSLLPGLSLAEVAAAVLQQPWIHVTETDPNGGKNEFWYSPVKDVSAWHDKDWIEYRDHRARLYFAYDLHDKVLYRVPEEMQRSMEHYASMIASVRILLQSKQPDDNQLKNLGFLGNEQARYEVVKQEFEKIKQDDREWLDYHLTVKGQDNKVPEPIQSQILFRVDPETKLLRLVRCEYDWKGKHVIAEEGFDYPDKGPADVYDLGVPKTATLVDRVPTNELSRILEAIRAGQQHMDDYRAVITQGGDRFPGQLPMIMYRKGDKFRTDGLVLWSPYKVKHPANGEDVGIWWRKRIQDPDMVFAPHYIQKGSTYFNVTTQCVNQTDGSEHVEIAGVEKHEFNVNSGDILPVDWSLRPEFACRPPMGIPHETLDPVLEQNPKEGPAGTILLHVRNIGPKLPRPQNSEGKLLPPRPDAWRYWFDPSRDYAVVRWEMVGDDGSGKETVDSTIIDKMAKSPQGTWYATQIRRKGAIRTPDDRKTDDEIITLYVEFNINLPDSLFVPPASGRIH